MNNDTKKVAKKTMEGANDLVKAHQAYNIHQGHKYKIEFDTSPTAVVSVFDTTAQSAKAKRLGRPAKGDWAIRLDKPHAYTEYDHININKNLSGRPDPHLKLPAHTLQVGKQAFKAAKMLNRANKAFIPIAIAVDAVDVGISVHDDIENGTSRNTVDSVVGAASGWAGGAAGVVSGAALGTAIFPVIGTIFGGIAGAVIGAVTVSFGATAVTEAIADALKYDIKTKKCTKCGVDFEVRQYQGEQILVFCPECDGESSDSD